MASKSKVAQDEGDLVFNEADAVVHLRELVLSKCY
jgi:hypothetical protein